ncbi:uncharacterized [Tachysurus ichikawai]
MPLPRLLHFFPSLENTTSGPMFSVTGHKSEPCRCQKHSRVRRCLVQDDIRRHDEHDKRNTAEIITQQRCLSRLIS